jgi:ECF sigma factor
MDRETRGARCRSFAARSASKLPLAFFLLKFSIYRLHFDIHRLTAGKMRFERGNHTLQPTALVNQAYLRLVGESDSMWEDRSRVLSTEVNQEEHAAQLIMVRRICPPHKDRIHLRRSVDRPFAFRLQSRGGPYIQGTKTQGSGCCRRDHFRVVACRKVFAPVTTLRSE